MGPLANFAKIRQTCDEVCSWQTSRHLVLYVALLGEFWVENH